ncbi:uridine kinase family protein [Angelakisella massiliensis]|uniref:uridine kinase family protein n=1 Tax=Angelakisella massiliensis TaxID=1871018 RepID=UPI0023A7F652|nr:nucleoside kinase [Angelakisella massiliensis]
MKPYTSEMDRYSYESIFCQIRQAPEKAVAMGEETFDAQIRALCREAVERDRRLLLVSGPSASGKTTTSKKIITCLEGMGKEVYRISLDNFYMEDRNLPLWEDGSVNFEAPECLDLDLFHQCLSILWKEGTAQFPIFDFTTSRRRRDKTFSVRYAPDTFLVVEGLHALNPRIRQAVGDIPSLGVYISIHSDFVDEKGKVVLSGRQLRLTRRIIRDLVRRDAPVEETLSMWDNVLRGERLYIHPWRGSADAHINSTIPYEPWLYRNAVMDAMGSWTGPEAHQKVVRELVDFYAGLTQLDTGLIPADSLTQEFLKTK